MAHAGFYFRDKAHLIKMIKQHAGVYNIKLPLSDEQIYKDIIVDDTLETFSSFYPNIYVLPANLNDLRVPTDPKVTTDSVSDVFELPNLWPLTEGNHIYGIAKILPLNSYAISSASYAYETIESFQTLALSQGLADLSSVIEPCLTFYMISPRRFRINNATYYRNRVVIYVEMSYNPELFDIPPGMRISFAELAELDFRRTIYNNLKYWNELRTAAAEFNLRIDDWQNAEDDRNELISQWSESFHTERSDSTILIF